MSKVVESFPPGDQIGLADGGVEIIAIENGFLERADPLIPEAWLPSVRHFAVDNASKGFGMIAEMLSY